MAERKPPPPPPASADPPASPQGRAAELAAVLAAGTGVAAGAAALAGPPILTAAVLAALTKLLLRWRYRRATVRWALRVTTRILRPPSPGAPSPVPGDAARANARAERVFAAWFLERTTARIEKAYDAGAADGDPEAREERFVDQHIDAQDRRRDAAEAVDREASKPGHVTDRQPVGPAELVDGEAGPRVILRWRAHQDDKVTPECAAADGCWFYADTPPIIGYPGMPHGGTCRCWPAHAGSLAEVARGRHVDEAVRGIVAAEPDHRPHPGTAPEREAG